MSGGNVSRLLLIVLTALLVLALAPLASAQTTSGTLRFEHDDSLDGDPNTEIVGGFFGAIPATGTPDEQRATIYEFLEGNDDDDDFDLPNPDRNFAWETFEFAAKSHAADGTPIENGSFTASVRWGNPDVDFDVSVYRRLADGALDPEPIAGSASGGTTAENATYFAPYSPADPQPPVETDCEPTPETTDPAETTQCRYVVYVDNWCSSDTDPTDVELAEDYGADFCEQGDYGDEDDWTGEVTFAPLVRTNVPPTADISGPASGTTGQDLVFTGSGTDSDGTIAGYAFDLDGDGRYEFDNGENATVSKRFDTAGTYSVGVRVTDDRGGVGYDSQAVIITGSSAAAPTVAAKPKPALVSSFKLGRPVFGGSRNAKLVIRYRLSEAARVTLSIYRGNRRVRRIVRNRSANRTYRLTVSPRRLKRGNYSIRLRAVTASGAVQSARLSAKRL